MERLHRLCRNASMRKSATAVSLQPAGSGNQETNSTGFNRHGSRRCIGIRIEGGKSMKGRKVRTVTLATFALVAVLCAPRSGCAGDAKTPYPRMAPLDQYLMDRDAEIALARSAAPPSIAKDATVMVLVKHGYETAVEGTNGFVCMVGRTWTDGFDRPEFWNPKNRGPACYNPQAARSVLPIDLMRTKFALAGQSKDEIHESMKA